MVEFERPCVTPTSIDKFLTEFKVQKKLAQELLDLT
jgi:hypothetical protein